MVAKEWGQLPSVVARDLDEDPEQLALVCLDLLRYSEAHAAYRRRDKKELETWKGDKMMELVDSYERDQVKAALEQALE